MWARLLAMFSRGKAAKAAASAGGRGAKKAVKKKSPLRGPKRRVPGQQQPQQAKSPKEGGIGDIIGNVFRSMFGRKPAKRSAASGGSRSPGGKSAKSVFTKIKETVFGGSDSKEQQSAGSPASPKPQPAGISEKIGGVIRRLFSDKPSPTQEQVEGRSPFGRKIGEKMSSAEMMQRGIFDRDKADEISRAEDDHLRETQKSARGLQKFERVLGKTAISGTLAGGALLLFSKQSRKAIEQVERNRELSALHGGLAAEYAKTDVQSFQLRRQKAQKTAGTGEELAQSYREFREDTKEIDALYNNAKNFLGSIFLKVTSTLLKPINMISAGINKLVNQGEEDREKSKPAGRELLEEFAHAQDQTVNGWGGPFRVKGHEMHRKPIPPLR